MTADGKGHVEAVILLVGVIVFLVLLVLGIVFAVSGRRALPWFSLSGAAFVITVGLLSYV